MGLIVLAVMKMGDWDGTNCPCSHEDGGLRED